MSSNFKRVESFIASCPACRENFFNLFCTFTCSPDQSLFVNVTQTAAKGDKLLVTEVDNLWSDIYGAGFYDSCKDVKFGATNSPAMRFIGGGAKNYTQFLKFLGDKKALGSPFQINFPRPDAEYNPGMGPLGDEKTYPCNTTDSRYRCACVDCDASCPALPEVAEAKSCHVGALPCLSFAAILVYSILITLLVIAVAGHVAYQKHAQNKNERLRLIQDTTFSDDEEDDNEILYQPRFTNRQPRKYQLNSACDRAFSYIGRMSARFPALTISGCLVVVGLLSLGWIRFAVETDPVRLWVAPDSEAASEKAFFDSNFGPFFRAEQAFLVNDTGSSGPRPVLSYTTLKWWFDVEKRVERIKTKNGYTFDDVCYKPTGDACVLQSVTGYFGGDWDMVDPYGWKDDLEDCVDQPVNCLPAFGQPLDSKLLFGGSNGSVLDSEALVITWVVKNYAEGSEETERAMEWEESLKNLLLKVQDEAKERGLRLSFNAEISLEQELNKSTNTDAKIVVISYIIMFIYASVALGSTTLSLRTIFRNPGTAFVQSKFSLGVAGIVIVLLSVSASVGLFSACGIKVTLIIAEVIPFLVLAVGVDNIFLIVHEFERVNRNHPDELVEDRVARALGRMGPSILLSASMETVAFSLGAFVGMPAVRNFAAYAAGAVLINALLQITMFVSVLALNQQRVEASRADCFPCVRVRQSDNVNPAYAPSEEDALQTFIRRTYAPFILGRKAKVVIVALFLGLFTAGIALLPTIELGLDQRIAIPEGSYLIQYFDDLYDYFESGPPVYFVTRELNTTARIHQRQLCGRFSTCDEFSLANILEQERKRPDVSYIADPTASWVDDFMLWLNPALETCCYDPRTGTPCFEDRRPPWNMTLSGMPQGEEFMHYLRRWIVSPTDEDCPLGGKAGYSDALVLPAPSNKSSHSQSSALTIPASHFRTAHTALRSQSDFISAYAAARRIASSINDANPGVHVFPYSKFYVFFDQYASIVRLTFTLLGAAVAACFLISSALLGSFRTGAVVSATVVMTLVDIGGAMALAGVSLNALTLVNLVICVGIAVEFCAHIARAFQFPPASFLLPASSSSSLKSPLLSQSTSSAAMQARTRRAHFALSSVGGSVVSGITLTKLLGVAVLAFTRSKVFEVYYFRVWLALVVLGALHALVWLPVALSFAGGEGWVDASVDEDDGGGGGGLEADLRRRVRGGGGGGGDGRGGVGYEDEEDEEDD